MLPRVCRDDNPFHVEDDEHALAVLVQREALPDGLELGDGALDGVADVGTLLRLSSLVGRGAEGVDGELVGVIDLSLPVKLVDGEGLILKQRTGSSPSASSGSGPKTGARLSTSAKTFFFPAIQETENV